MAREHATEESNRNSFVSEESNSSGFTSDESSERTGRGEPISVTCPQCEARWTCSERADPACPDCGSSFSVRVRDEFALVERGGWTVAVSLGSGERQGVVDG